MMEQQLAVENIKCGGCMNSIQTALMKLNGVEAVTIDKECETLVVRGEITREKLVHELNRLGYPEKGNNTLMQKAKSYVSCAIGNLT